MEMFASLDLFQLWFEQRSLRTMLLSRAFSLFDSCSRMAKERM